MVALIAMSVPDKEDIEQLMLYGKYRFNCRFENVAVLPPYKGSTFRGVFGSALKKVVCSLKRQECTKCLLRQRCLYSLVFETGIAINLPDNSKMSSPPHPYVIEPPLDYRGLIKTAGDVKNIFPL